MSIGDICNRNVVVIEKDAPVQEAARLMREYHVGDLVVCTGPGDERKPAGVITDRDIVVEVLGAAVDVNSVMAGDIMSTTLLTAREDDELWDTLRRMRDAGVRRIPVVDMRGLLLGIVTMDDVIELLADELAQLAKLVARERKVEQTYRSRK